MKPLIFRRNSAQSRSWDEKRNGKVMPSLEENTRMQLKSSYSLVEFEGWGRRCSRLETLLSRASNCCFKVEERFWRCSHKSLKTKWPMAAVADPNPKVNQSNLVLNIFADYSLPRNSPHEYIYLKFQLEHFFTNKPQKESLFCERIFGPIKTGNYQVSYQSNRPGKKNS